MSKKRTTPSTVTGKTQATKKYRTRKKNTREVRDLHARQGRYKAFPKFTAIKPEIVGSSETRTPDYFKSMSNEDIQKMDPERIPFQSIVKYLESAIGKRICIEGVPASVVDVFERPSGVAVKVSMTLSDLLNLKIIYSPKEKKQQPPTVSIYVDNEKHIISCSFEGMLEKTFKIFITQ